MVRPWPMNTIPDVTHDNYKFDWRTVFEAGQCETERANVSRDWERLAREVQRQARAVRRLSSDESGAITIGTALSMVVVLWVAFEVYTAFLAYY